MIGMLLKMEDSDGVVYTILFPTFGEKLKMLDFILRIVRMKSELRCKHLHWACEPSEEFICLN